MSTNVSAMSLTIGIEEMQDYLSASFEADLCPVFKSMPGIGKTTAVYDYYEAQKAAHPDKKVGLFFINGANANVSDLIGYLMPKDATYETDNGVVTLTEGRYTFPHFLFDIEHGKPIFLFDIAIICIDEYGQMGGEEKRSIGTMLLERRCGLYHLPKGARIVLLSNRAQDKAGVSKDFSHMANRMQHFNVVTNVKAVTNYGIKHGWNPFVLAFANRNAEIVCADEVPDEIGPMCTPRSVDQMDKWLKTCEVRGWAMTAPQTKVGSAGLIGPGAMRQFVAMVDVLDDLPRLSSVVRDPKGAKLPENPSARYLIAFELAVKTTHENIEPVITYMRRMPQSYAVCYLSTILKDRKFFSHRCVGDWFQDNYELMAALGDIAK